MKNKLSNLCNKKLIISIFFVLATYNMIAQNRIDATNNNKSKTELDSLNELDSLKIAETILEKTIVQKLNAEGVLSKRLIEQFGYGGFVVADQNTRISIGGLIIGNAYQDFREMTSENRFAISKIPSNASRELRTRFDVGNSRFFINSDIHTEILDYKTRFEFDFFSGSGEYVFRFRHAFVEFGRFGVGFTNSVFGNIDITPDVIDNGGAPSEIGSRQTQIRYVHPLSSTTRFAISLEDCEGTVLKNDTVTPSRRISPDIAANFRYKPEYSNISQFHIAGVIHPLEYEQKSNPFTGRFGWGVNAGTALNLVGIDYLSCQLFYSNGATKYINDPIVPYDAIIKTNLDSALEITPVKMFGTFLYYHHRWSENYASNVGYSYISGDRNQFSSNSQEIEGHYASANIIYYPNNKMSFAFEPIWGMRKNIDGKTAFNLRVQLQVKFSF
jgi:hypothetical protein